MAISLDVLASFAPFNTLNHEYLIQVAEKAALRDVPKGTIIFKRGRPFPEKVYLVGGTVDLIDSAFQVNTINPASESRRSPLNITQPTQVSAVAKSDVTLLAVDSDFLDLVLAWSESSDEEADLSGVSLHDDNDWMSSLLQSPLFSRLPPANIRQLFIRFTAQKVQADEVVIKQGERGDYFYVLESGSATVIDPAGKILAALRPGNYFGEEALVGDTTRNATVKMLTPGKVMRLNKEDFRELLQEPVLRYLSAEELRSRPADAAPYQIIDVRLPLERRMQAVPGSQNIPLNQLRNHLKNLDFNTVYLVTDDSGRRCDVATHLLNQAGFDCYILRDAESCYAGL
ncbi:cyclic nucleotide-binding domain protein [Cellvibrio sp. BR]|jgi:signal-transduction protein with cAMP-binding, CBS, and nucleotidyltransferase domain|uniref:cyclic nucleotide-binding domain-containing protein n=1 Tax=Cellvibrio sp. BR TaxID=1134474 RepID=UPI00026010D6|nr:cyclic nucleotide-binding domain-containing protein [Cellvibrio sp. BR]EIK45680.1 cyclic nucleotide-binding domain protein [Cellvibrio sp. BR]